MRLSEILVFILFLIMAMLLCKSLKAKVSALALEDKKLLLDCIATDAMGQPTNDAAHISAMHCKMPGSSQGPSKRDTVQKVPRPVQPMPSAPMDKQEDNDSSTLTALTPMQAPAYNDKLQAFLITSIGLANPAPFPAEVGDTMNQIISAMRQHPTEFTFTCSTSDQRNEKFVQHWVADLAKYTGSDTNLTVEQLHFQRMVVADALIRMCFIIMQICTSAEMARVTASFMPPLPTMSDLNSGITYDSLLMYYYTLGALPDEVMNVLTGGDGGAPDCTIYANFRVQCLALKQAFGSIKDSNFTSYTERYQALGLKLLEVSGMSQEDFAAAFDSRDGYSLKRATGMLACATGKGENMFDDCPAHGHIHDWTGRKNLSTMFMTGVAIIMDADPLPHCPHHVAFNVQLDEVIRGYEFYKSQ